MAKRLTLEETKNCLRAWRELNDENALELLVNCNGGLINYFVKKYLGKGVSYDDLASAGKEGLIRAISKFNYEERAIEGFSTYVSISIENEILNELRRYNKHSHNISLEEPIGRNKHGDDMKLEDIIGTDSEELIETVISEMKIDIVREALQCLTRKEQQIILLRYGLDDVHRKTLDEVAEIFNCSKKTISKQEQRALIKMRHPRNTKKLKDLL